MQLQLTKLPVLASALFGTLLSAQAPQPSVRFVTNLGNIDVTLTPDVAPLTVANFLNYVGSGAYVNTIFHRLAPGFVAQGGGYTLVNSAPVAIPQNAAVVNEFNVTNSKYTIAMAKLGTDPNSATNQWFFNLADNGANLDSQNGGFTVFGKAANSTSQHVIDAIGALTTVNQGAPFDQLPVYKYTSGNVVAGNYVLVSSIAPLPTTSSAGFESAASFASSASAGISPGEILTVFGSGLGPATLATLTIDSNGVVTNSLAGTQVTFDGTPGAMVYTSYGQISVVAPYSLANKTITRVIVTNNGIQSTAINLPVVPANPGLFTLNASGKGDAAIVRLDGSIVNNASPASPGDILILYGTGYGVASPAFGDGAIVGANLPRPVAATSLLIDGQTVPTLYAGGAPTLINGVLQVNFTVPQLSPGSHMIQFQVGQRPSPTGVNLQTK